MNLPAVLQVMTESAIRGGVMIGCAAGVAWLLRDRPAAVRASLWRVALLLLMLVPLTSAFVPRWSIPVLPSSRIAPVGVVRPTTESVVIETARSRQEAAPEAPSLVAILLALWLAGVGAFAVRLVVSHLSLARLVRSSRLPENDDEFLGLERELRPGRPVSFRISDRITVPMACGWRRPTVLLPEAFPDWSAETRRAVLVHELSHLQRNDPFWHALAAVARILHWYHPFAWWALHRLRAESEHACDEAVIRSGELPSGYARTLLTIATLPVDHAPRAALAMVRKGGLEMRIEAILSGRGMKQPFGRTQRVALAVVALVLGFGITLAQPVARAGSPQAAPEAPTPRPESAGSRTWIDRARHADPVDAAIRNDRLNPVQIRDAKVRMASVTSGSVGVTMPELVLENTDGTRTVSEVVLALDLPNTRDRMSEPVRIPPEGSAILRVDPAKWSAVARTIESGQLLVSIVAVEFSDGGHWGIEDTPKPPKSHKDKSGAAAIAPTPRPRDQSVTPPDWDGASRAAQIRNLEGAPVVIVDARTPVSPATPDGAGSSWLPSVRVENRSSSPVVALRIRYKAEPRAHAVSGFDVEIAPGSSAELHKATWIDGRADDMTVQLLGARFADGTVVGSMGSRIDARWPWVENLDSGVELPVATTNVEPVYPEEAKRAGIEGTVLLEVLVRSNGTVARVRVAESDAPELDDAAVQAIRQWKFKPGTVNGKPASMRVDVSLTFRPR